MNNERTPQWAVMLGAAIFATGCAQMRMGPPVPAIDNIAKARASGIAAVAVGSFQLASGKDPAMDLSVVARTNTIFP